MLLSQSSKTYNPSISAYTLTLFSISTSLAPDIAIILPPIPKGTTLKTRPSPSAQLLTYLGPSALDVLPTLSSILQNLVNCQPVIFLNLGFWGQGCMLLFWDENCFDWKFFRFQAEVFWLYCRAILEPVYYRFRGLGFFAWVGVIQPPIYILLIVQYFQALSQNLIVQIYQYLIDQLIFSVQIINIQINLMPNFKYQVIVKQFYNFPNMIQFYPIILFYMQCYIMVKKQTNQWFIKENTNYKQQKKLVNIIQYPFGSSSESFEMNNEQDFYNPYRIFKIPSLPVQMAEGGKNKVVIGLIDASGSMSSFWKDMAKFWNQTIAEQAHMLITFSQNAKLQEHPYIDQDIKKHGGGMTNILAAFQLLQQRLQNVPKESSITIVFISDGEDTVHGQGKLKKQMQKLNGGKGRDITFICLGIKSGFPTSISMQLRKLYHTGDQTIPAVYLIQYVSQKAFFNKFQTMSNCFKANNKITAPDAGDYCKQYPWQSPGHVKFQQQKWIMVHKQFKIMKIVYNEKKTIQYEVPSLKAVPLQELVDCFRGWVQKIQLLSMDNSKMKQVQLDAALAAKTMRQFTKQYELLFDLFIIRQKPIEVKQSFKTRAMNLAVKNVGVRIKWYLDQLDIIAKGSGIGQLNEYEAAKRIAIGTITGKYHQKALALKGITVKDFIQIKQQFTKSFKQAKLSQKPSSQDVSIFTLQNQKQVFQQPDFLEGLNYCKTQFDLVQTFPVVGYGLKVKRYDGSMINPWKVRLQSLAVHHKTIDSMYLAKNSNKYQLKIGNDQTQQINAVLPLFDLQDGEMSNLFNSRLFRLAISFMVVQNIDTYHDQAYLALLGAVFVYLLKQPKSDWKKQMLQKIYSSIKVTYGATQQFQKFILDVEQDPFNLFKAKSLQDHVDIVKVMLIVFYISQQKRLQKQKILHLADLALVHYVQKTYVQNQFKIFKVAQIKLGQIGQQIQMKKEQEQINAILGQEELKKIVDKQLGKYLGDTCMHVQLTQKIFLHQDQEKRVTYSQINKFFKFFNSRPLQKNQILYYFGHYLKGKSKQNYNSPISREIKQTQKLCSTQINPKDLKVGQGKKVTKLRKSIQDKFLDTFRSAHFGILPLTKSKLQDLCAKQGYNRKDYDFNQSTGLIRNSCMSPHCLYYMKKLTPNQMRSHLGLWRGQVPARFHMNVLNMLRAKKDPKEICAEIIKSGVVNLKKHKKNQDFVLNYITEIAKTFQQK